MFSQNKALVERGHAEVKELQLPLNVGVILSTLNTGLRRIAWARVVPTFPLTASPAQPPPLIPRPSAQAPKKRECQQTEKARTFWWTVILRPKSSQCSSFGTYFEISTSFRRHSGQ